MRRLIFCVLLVCTVTISAFSQASAIREYVGMISQSFHPDVVSYMRNLQAEFQKQGYDAAARSVDTYLKGESGTGFVYVAGNGRNYIITNFHVISHALTDGLSISFENLDGERTTFSGLSIVAADEEMDIALLAFPAGQNPFRQGLAFLRRPVQEGEDVYSAGFPGLGNVMIWQLGRGMVSNASVRLPDLEDDTRTIGPFIQHTAQVDPGNSGGPLLVQTQGVPAGFAVAGINTLSARFRQGANFSIPMHRVQSFLDIALSTRTTGVTELEARIDAFLEGLQGRRSVYSHIARFLSNTCTAENIEYAESEFFRRAPRAVREEVVQTFYASPVTGMSHIVAWTIENAIRSRSGNINIEKVSVSQIDSTTYTVDFNVNGTVISSEWINEYGIWRIGKFGDFAAGDKSLVQNRQRELLQDRQLRSHPGVQISAGSVYILERGPGFTADILLRLGYTGFGFKTFIAKDLFQVESFFGPYIPLRAEKVAFTPFADLGLGVQIVGNIENKDPNINNFVAAFGFHPELLPTARAGIQFTTAWIPGLYVQVAYQYNIIIDFFNIRSQTTAPPDNHMVLFSIGYSF